MRRRLLLLSCLSFALSPFGGRACAALQIIDQHAAEKDAQGTSRAIPAGCKGIPLPPSRSLKQLVSCIAESERAFRLARDQYTFRQTFEFIEEGGGTYRAVTDITFTPEGKRIEKRLKRPINALKRIRLTEEDFRDLSDVQPFVLDPDDLWNLEVGYLEEQTLRGIPTFTMRIRPRQTFEGQRLFDGVIWVKRDDLQVIQIEGRAVPNLVTHGQENLFPRFTTTREKIDGSHWFPVLTVADDTLKFASGPIRIHFTIKYEQYKRFKVESRIQYDAR